MTMDQIFDLYLPEKIKIPILVSVPHSGTLFPESIKSQLKKKFIDTPEDTDWYVDQLYSFVAEMGIPLIKAKYSRYLIDLNRSNNNTKLYQNDRVQTDLVPINSFKGETLYKEVNPEQKEINSRIEAYYNPYYQELKIQLDQIKNQFGKALLFDAHSIPRNVSTIQKENFPDLILGTNDGQSANEKIIKAALNTLDNSLFHTTHNHPFKGGQITRSFGNPSKNVHAIQLEMSQDVYMDTEKKILSKEHQKKIIPVLKSLFEELAKVLEIL